MKLLRTGTRKRHRRCVKRVIKRIKSAHLEPTDKSVVSLIFRRSNFKSSIALKIKPSNYCF